MEEFKNCGSPMRFSRKGYGRIFVEKEEDINKVKDIIKEIDEYEFSYLPDGFIAVFNENNMHAVYTHKFCDLDIQLLCRVCWERGIHMFPWYGSIDGVEHL